MNGRNSTLRSKFDRWSSSSSSSDETRENSTLFSKTIFSPWICKSGITAFREFFKEFSIFSLSSFTPEELSLWSKISISLRLGASSEITSSDSFLLSSALLLELSTFESLREICSRCKYFFSYVSLSSRLLAIFSNEPEVQWFLSCCLAGEPPFSVVVNVAPQLEPNAESSKFFVYFT